MTMSKKMTVLVEWEQCPRCGHHVSKHGSDGCFTKNGHDEYCSCSQVPQAVADRDREERRLHHLKTPCPDHPRYQVKNKPRTMCEKCWRMFTKVQAL